MFLFEKRKGSMGSGGQPVGGLTIIAGLVCLWLLWPNIKANFNISIPSASNSAVVETDVNAGNAGSANGNANTGNAEGNGVSESAGEKDKNSADHAIDLFGKIFDSATSGTSAEQDGFTYNSDKAKEMLKNVQIADANWDVDGDGKGDYDRNSWEKPAKKFTSEYSGKKIGIKNYVLEQQVHMAYDDKNFSFVCPYTGETISNANKIDYDHIIPLAYVDGHGGNKWTAEKKNEFAFNTSVGICVSASSNRAKGAKGPAEWMPSMNQKWYCYRWLQIATEYNISISQADYDVISSYFDK